MHLQPVPVGLEPGPDVGVLVIASVVLNQDCALAAVSSGELFEEFQIRGGIERVVLAIVEARAPEFDCAENLHALAFSGDRHFRRAAHAAPCSMKRRILPETGFVGEDQRPVSRAGFFLRPG